MLSMNLKQTSCCTFCPPLLKQVSYNTPTSPYSQLSLKVAVGCGEVQLYYSFLRILQRKIQNLFCEFLVCPLLGVKTLT